MGKRWTLSTGNLPQGGLPRNNVDRITDRPNMTSAVDRGRKALTQTNKQNFITGNFSILPYKGLSIIRQKCNGSDSATYKLLFEELFQ